MKEKFYLCELCGNLTHLINEGPGVMVCCNQDMTLLEEHLVDQGSEKHIPVLTTNETELTIEIGDIHHPMEEAHYIDFVYIKYSTSGELIKLDKTAEPVIKVDITGKSVVSVYAYCNIHGLWKASA